MARYGIDRALLAAARPETDRPADRMIDVPNPWADVRAHLLAGLVSAMRCQCVLLPVATGKRVHVFGYASDLERTELLYTSLLVQMAHGLAATQVPATARSPRAWRRSWLLGYSSAVTARVRAAEERAASDATSSGRDRGGTSTELVLADALGRPVPGVSRGPGGQYVQLWPHRHGTDALFLALLRRDPT